MPPLKTFGEAEIGVAGEDTTTGGQINPAFVSIHEDEVTDLARAATPVANGRPAEDKTNSTDAKRPPSGRISPSDVEAKGKQLDLLKELITGEGLVKSVSGSGPPWKADEGQRKDEDTGQPDPDDGLAIGTQVLWRREQRVTSL